MSEEQEIIIFNWYYINEFTNWELLSHNEHAERKVLLGEKKEDKINVIIKKFVITEKAYRDLLKEVYFLACCKNNKYFAEIIDVFPSNCNNYLFIVLRHEGTDLKSLIDYEYFDYNTAIPNFSRFAIFQIVCGLKILHSNGLSHNDIKPGNIIVSENGKIKICDMGSTDKISTIKYGGTASYSSPQCLLGKKRTKEDDMWSVGIVFLELLKKRNGIFNLIINQEMRIEDKNKLILKNILENYYDINLHETHNDNTKYNIIINKISNDEYNSFEAKLKSNLLTDINNEDKELIENLLQIDPSKRKTAEEVLNLKMFKDLQYQFEDSNFEYQVEDYTKYLKHKIDSVNNFKGHLEQIREKFIDKVIFEIKDNNNTN